MPSSDMSPKAPPPVPSSPLGDVTDTVTVAAVAGLHAVVGVPSAVSSLPIVDREDISVTQDATIRASTPSNERDTSSESSERQEPQWSCAECTFLNHPALKECEQCEMPRVMIGTELHRAHQAKNCFCHPQDVVSSSTSTSFQPLVATSLLSNTFRSTTTQPISAKDCIRMMPVTDQFQSTSSSTDISSDATKQLDKITKTTLDRDDSSPSESTPCT